MAKPLTGLSAVQEFFAAVSAGMDMKGSRLFASELGQSGRFARRGQIWIISASRARKLGAMPVVAGQVMAHDQISVAAPDVAELSSAVEVLADQVTAHADAVERRGDEIDAMLIQIRASMPASQAI